LISAPAGYGKTTLVAAWLQESQIRSAWLSLDESDNDPRRFLDYLLAALCTIQPDLGTAVEAMLQSPQPPPGEVLMTALVNDMAALAQPFTLVLDDYHVIHAPPIHEQLNFLLEYRPSQLHLVIISREDPPLPLPRHA
jgi:LuxR family maltose regulon positive regulatory protein